MFANWPALRACLAMAENRPSGRWLSYISPHGRAEQFPVAGVKNAGASVCYAVVE
jgi:hypothetical protein